MLSYISSSCSGNHSAPQGCCSRNRLITVGILASALLLLLGPLLANFGLINAVTAYSLLAVGGAGFIFSLFMCKRWSTSTSPNTCRTLSEALYEGNLEAVRGFITPEVNLETPLLNGRTPLFIAMTYTLNSLTSPSKDSEKYFEVTEFLISKGARFDLILPEKHYSPLGYAIDHHSERLVKLLLNGTGDLNADCHDYGVVSFPKNPLEFAKSQLDMFDEGSPLHKASQTIVTLLETELKKGAGC